MQQDNFGYIYKTTNLINGRLYIGQKKGTFTISYLGSGKILKEAIFKYGKQNFRLEVLAFATTQKMLDGLEKKHIYEYRQVFGERFLYNICDGGSISCGGNKALHKNNCLCFICRPHDGENNAMYGVRRFKENSPNWGRKFGPMSESEKLKRSLKLKGIKRGERTASHKKNISLARIGKSTPGSGFPKGNIPWNKGLKKSTPQLMESTNAK